MSQEGTVELHLSNGTFHTGKTKAYIQFYLAIDAQALNRRHAGCRKTQTTNEEYTFRTWLLRLGLNGDESVAARRHLLASLSGCIAWRDPAQMEAQKEWLRQKREGERKQILRQPEERQEEVVEPEEAEQVETRAPTLAVSM